MEKFKEYWKTVIIDGVEHPRYMVSNLGRVKCKWLRNGKWNMCKLSTVSAGYYGVEIDGRMSLVHRLVAEAFLPNPQNKHCIDHIFTLKTQNVVLLDDNGNVLYSTIRWCTHKENQNNMFTRRHLSEKNKGKTPWIKGRHHTEEANEKNRQAHLGKKHTEEARRKIGESHLGKKHTEEARRKMSEKQKGRIVSEETKRKISKSQIGKRMGSESGVARPIYQLDKNTNDIIRKFDCTRTASRELGILDSCIYNCLRGFSKSAGGYRWVYASDYKPPRRLYISDIKPLF